MTLTQMSQFRQRVIVGGIGTVIVLTSIYLSSLPIFKPIFSLSVAFLISLAMMELYQIARTKNFNPAEKLGICVAVLYTSAVTISTQYASNLINELPQITLLFSLLLCFLYYFVKGVAPFSNVSVTIFSVAYLVVPLSCIISIAYFFDDNSLQDGRWWLLYMIAVAKMTDLGGYFFGKKFGKQKLAPYISPKKTIEGAIGGLCTAIISSVIIMLLGSVWHVSFSLTFWQSIWLGACIGVVAQFGDLAESLLKRDGGIKDSSHLPGLGGILDIVDSLIFAAPLVYIFLKIQAQS